MRVSVEFAAVNTGRRPSFCNRMALLRLNASVSKGTKLEFDDKTSFSRQDYGNADSD